MESSSNNKYQQQSCKSTSVYTETPISNVTHTSCNNQEHLKDVEEREASISTPNNSKVHSSHPESIMFCNLDLDAQEIDKLFGILFESDTTAFNEFAGHERERTTFKPVRRFAPYPIHQQLFMQQQQEQERRRQSLMTLASSRTTSSSRDFRDIFRCRDARLMYSNMFRSKIVRTVIAFINKHTIRISSTRNDFTEKCVICMCNYQVNQGLRELRCNHRFHRKCIDEWLVKSYLCPVCRTDLTGTGKVYKGLAVLYHMWKEEEDTAEYDSASNHNLELGQNFNDHNSIIESNSSSRRELNANAKKQICLFEGNQNTEGCGSSQACVKSVCESAKNTTDP